MGAVEEGVEVDAHIKRNMKKREAPLGSEDPRLLTSGLQQSLDVKISAVEGTTSHVNASATRSVE